MKDKGSLLRNKKMLIVCQYVILAKKYVFLQFNPELHERYRNTF